MATIKDLPSHGGSGGNILDGVVYDYVALVQASLTDTWTFKQGGSSGVTTAIVVITYTSTCKETISNVERTA